MFKIVNANPTHAHMIAEVWNPIIRDTYATFNSQEKSATEIAEIIAVRNKNGQAFILAMDGKKLAGFATYFQFRGGIGYRHTMEHTVMIAPEFHGQGIGKSLMAEIERHAKAAQNHSLIAGICSINTNGIEFHAKCGFEKAGYLPQVGHKNGRWLDLVLMQKML